MKICIQYFWNLNLFHFLQWTLLMKTKKYINLQKENKCIAKTLQITLN